MKREKELVRNTFIIAVGKSTSQAVSLILLPLFTIFLTPSDYGFLDLITTYIFLLVPVVTLQLEVAAFRFLIDSRNDSKKITQIISNTLQLNIIFLTIFVVIILSINLFVGIKYMPLILMNIAVTVFYSFFLQVARGLGHNKHYAKASIINSLITLLATLGLVVAIGLKIDGAITSIIIANTVGITYLFFSVGIYKYININSLNNTIKKKLLKYSTPIVSSGISLWIVNASDRTIISIMLSVAANGIYSVANKFSTILMSIYSIFDMSWMESISLHINSDDSDKFISSILNTSIKIFSCIGLLLIAAVPFLFTILINRSYHEALNYIPIMIIGALFSLTASIYGAIYIAKNMTKKVANTSIVSAIINISLTLLLIKPLGLYGAALATTISFILMASFRHFDLRRYIEFKYNTKLMLTILVAYLIAIAAYYSEIKFHNIISLIFTILFVTIINRRELRFILNNINKTVRRRDE